MEATEYTQMNVRMPVALKRDGVSALASIGYIPTEAVRALWAKAAARGKGLEEVAAVLSAEGAGANPAGDPLNGIRRGRAAVDDALISLGIGKEALARSVLDDGTALEAAHDELAHGKGWM